MLLAGIGRGRCARAAQRPGRPHGLLPDLDRRGPRHRRRGRAAGGAAALRHLPFGGDGRGDAEVLQARARPRRARAPRRCARAAASRAAAAWTGRAAASLAAGQRLSRADRARVPADAARRKRRSASSAETVTAHCFAVFAETAFDRYEARILAAAFKCHIAGRAARHAARVSALEATMSTDLYTFAEEPGEGGRCAAAASCSTAPAATSGSCWASAASLMPAARLVSPRGDVSEGGAARFFRRTGEGVYDMADFSRATGKMAAFVRAHAEPRAGAGHRARLFQRRQHPRRRAVRCTRAVRHGGADAPADPVHAQAAAGPRGKAGPDHRGPPRPDLPARRKRSAARSIFSRRAPRRKSPGIRAATRSRRRSWRRWRRSCGSSAASVMPLNPARLEDGPVPLVAR